MADLPGVMAEMTRRTRPTPAAGRDATSVIGPFLAAPATLSDLRVSNVGFIADKRQWIHHQFGLYAMGFVVAGHGSYRVGDDGPVRRVGPGCVFTVYPGPTFHYGADPGTGWDEYHVGLVGPGMQRLLASGVFFTDGSVRQLVDVGPIVETIREIVRVLKRGELGDADRAVLLAERVFTEAHFRQASLRKQQTPSEAMEGVLLACRQRFADGDDAIDFAALAAEHAMSYSALRQQMRRVTGVPPAKYVTRLRCDAACALLSDTDLSVKEIAARVGIGDPYTFSRTFRRSVGVSPQKYREQTAPWAKRR